MSLFAILTSTLALGAQIQLDADVHGHTASITLDDVAGCTEQSLSFADDNGSWDFHIEGGALEDGALWMRVDVHHTWTDGSEDGDVRTRPTFLFEDGEVTSLTIGEDIHIEVKASGLQRDDLFCLPRALNEAHRESRHRSARTRSSEGTRSRRGDATQ